MIMGPGKPRSEREKFCPYCGTKVVRDDNYCISCRRTFVDPPVDNSISSPEEVKREWRKSTLAAILSLAGVGLGQFYNGETYKGLIFLTIVIGALFILPVYTSLSPLIVVLVVWAASVADAYLSAEKINQLKKPFSRKSLFFWPEVTILIILAGAVILAGTVPHTAAQGVSLMAGAVAGTKYPVYALPLYETALSLAPGDTAIQMDKVSVMHALGQTDEARKDLERLMVTNPNETAPVIMTGNLLYDEGQYRESVRYFEKALAINSEDAQVWVRKGDAYLAISIQEMQKIRGKYRTLTSNNHNVSSSSDAPTMDAFRSTQSYQEAVKAYNQAIKIDPFTSVEISGRILASTQALLTTYQGILDDIGMENVTSDKT
jgi:TM2 domain-containing membrane protein YozV